MSRKTDETSTAYVLSCISCSFETNVEGEITDALNVCSTHEEAHTDDPSRHFVEFEKEGES